MQLDQQKRRDASLPRAVSTPWKVSNGPFDGQRSDVRRRGELAGRWSLLMSSGVARIDHVGIVGADFLMQALGRVRNQIAVLMNRAPLHLHAIPNGGDCFLQSRRASTMRNAGCRRPRSIRSWRTERQASADSLPMFLTASIPSDRPRARR